MRSFAALMLVMLLVLPGAFPSGTAGQYDDPVLVCVTSGKEKVAALGLEIEQQYDSFITLYVDDHGLALLDRAKASYFTIDGRDDVWLPACKMVLTKDQLQGKGLHAISLGPGEKYLILKYSGPVKQEWLSKVSASGLQTVGGPLHGYNVVVRGNWAAISTVAAFPFVRWLGELRQYHKLPYPLPDNGDVSFDMVFFKQALSDFNEALGIIRAMGGTLHELDNSTQWWNSALVNAPSGAARLVLGLPGLWTLETVGKTYSRNDNARWVIQSFDSLTNATPFWDNGITGEGLVVGLADSGMDYDHVAFRDMSNEQGVPGPQHRKIVRYNTTVDDWDQLGHGTHVAGSLAGDSIITPMGYDANDGMAYGSKIAFYDIVDINGTWDPPLIRGILGDAYEAGARLHSDSWGDDRTDYTLRAQRMDQFQWDCPDFLSFVAAGNIGPAAGTVQEPATAKNIVAVGAARNGNSNGLASFSSHGPTQEGLIAPTIVAPGQSVYSAASDSQQGTFNDGYKWMSGTSMATPIAAGAAGLVQQYFRDGFYPEGYRNEAEGFFPSGPLVKAVLVSSAVDQFGGEFTEGYAPDFGQGWGKIRLSGALYLNNYAPSKRLWVSDYYNTSYLNDGLSTGETRMHRITVNSSSPLKVVLAWNDWPGAGIVNDLNLEVVCPNGTVYRGNQFLNGSSVISHRADTQNTVEAIIIPNPPAGMYTLNVTALIVGNGSRQRYSLVASGDLFDSSVGQVQFDRERTGLNSTVAVKLTDSDLRGTGIVSLTANASMETETLHLNEIGNSGVFSGLMEMASGPAFPDGTLQVRDRDIVTVTYIDDSPVGLSRDTLTVDGAPPLLLRHAIENITNTTAFVVIESNEPCAARVLYWNRLSSWSSVSERPSFIHGMELTGLYPRNNYSYDIELSDSFGNIVLYDYGGNHTQFTTYDLTGRPRPGYAGYAVMGEEWNHFEEQAITAGIINSKLLTGAFRIDIPDFPSGAVISAGELRLMVKDTDGARSDGTWTVSLMSAGAHALFDGTHNSPNFTAISETPKAMTLFSNITSASLNPGKWQVLLLSPEQCAAISKMAVSGPVSFCIEGPPSGMDSVVGWYGGGSENTLSLAPQLDMVLDFPPKVFPWAVMGFEMREDTVDSTHVNLTGVFGDEEVLDYDAPGNFEGSGANVTVNISRNGRTEFRPRRDWNGMEQVELRAKDTFGLIAVHTVNVIVRPVNDPPLIVSINGTVPREGMVFSVLQGETFTTTVIVSDPDIGTDGETVWYLTNDTLVRFPNQKVGILSFTPANNDMGNRRVQLVVRDSDYQDTLNVTFQILNVNDPPVAYIDSPYEGQKTDNETAFQLSASGTDDPDLLWGEILNFTWESNISGVLGWGAQLSIKLVSGNHRLTLTVADLDGVLSIASVDVRVDAVIAPPPPPPPPPPPQDSGKDNSLDLAYRFLGVSSVLALIVVVWALANVNGTKEIAHKKPVRKCPVKRGKRKTGNQSVLHTKSKITN